MTTPTGNTHRTLNPPTADTLKGVIAARGRQPKRGAPVGNHNARVRHGLTAGYLPQGCGYVARITQTLGQSLENEVLNRRREITVFDAATIQTAIRWERHCLLALRWLRKEPNLNIEQRLALSREIARGSAERDKCLKSLGLDKNEQLTLLGQIHQEQDDADDSPPDDADPTPEPSDPPTDPQEPTPADDATRGSGATTDLKEPTP